MTIELTAAQHKALELTQLIHYQSYVPGKASCGTGPTPSLHYAVITTTDEKLVTCDWCRNSCAVFREDE